MNVFEKIHSLREGVKNIFPEMGFEELSKNVEFLANYWHGKKRKKGVRLNQQQLIIYELLSDQGYSPNTVYKWILLANAPQTIKEKVRNNEITIIQALSEKRKNKKETSVTEQQFIDTIIQCIENFVSEAGENYPGRVVNGKR